MASKDKQVEATVGFLLSAHGIQTVPVGGV